MPETIDLQPDTQTEGLRKYGRVTVDRFDMEVSDDELNGYTHTKDIREQVGMRLPSEVLDIFAAGGIDIIGFEQTVDTTKGASGTPLVANVTGVIGIQCVWLTDPPDGTDHGPHMYVFAKQGPNGTEAIPTPSPRFPERADARLFIGRYDRGEEYTLGDWEIFHESLEGRLLSGRGLGSDHNDKICLVSSTWEYLTLEFTITPTKRPCIRNSTFRYGRQLVTYLNGEDVPDADSFSLTWQSTPTLLALKESRRGSSGPAPDNQFADDDFVEASGSEFKTASETVNFGANNAELRKRSSEEITDWLETWKAKLHCDGNQQLDVLRAPAFGCDTDSCLPIEPASGEYSELALEQLDDLVDQCERNGVRLILYLTNYWAWQGGIPKYLQWHGEITETEYVNARKDDNDITVDKAKKLKFYTDDALKNHFKSHIDTILDRTNTITGRQYKNDPTIMMWELANEPRPAGDEGKFLTWIEEFANYIDNKYSSDRTQLISTGLGANYSANEPVPSYFDKAHGKQNIDAWSMHLWVDPEHLDGSVIGNTIQERINNGLKIIKKHREQAGSMPFYVGEFGWKLGQNNSQSNRNKAFKQWQSALKEHADASLAWDLRTDHDERSEFKTGIFSKDSTTIGHLKTIAGCEGQ